eukprot:5177153-Alexandrium_andersonii.AAC.1
MVQAIPNRNGYEAWRQLVRRFSAFNPGSNLAALSEILKAPELQNLATDKFAEGLLMWENRVEYYQRVSGLR